MSGNKQSTPSVVFPLIPSGIIVLHFGNYFLVTTYMACLTYNSNLALLSLPKDVYSVEVPYVIIDTSMLNYF